MPVAIPAIALGISAIGTGYSIYQSQEAKSDAKDQAADQRRRAAESEKKLKEGEIIRDLGRQAAEQRRRQKVLAAGAGGWRDTLLTGPGGAPVPSAGLKQEIGA